MKSRRALALTVLLALLQAVAVAGGGALLEFDAGDRCEWRVINDGVMGGLSRSGIELTERGTGLFAGELSLENYGGFASVRALMEPQDLSAEAGLELRVLGDGRSYQLRLRGNDRFDGIAYRAEFETKPGEWLTVRIPFEQFQPTFRGRVVRDAPPLDTAQVRQVGFLLGDGRPGPFALEIDFLRAYAGTL